MSKQWSWRRSWPELVILLVTVVVAVAWETRGLSRSRPSDAPPLAAHSPGDPWPPPGLAGPRPSGRGLLPDLRAAWDEGVRQADDHLRDGSPHGRVYGKVTDGMPAIDLETGLPLEAQAGTADERTRAIDEGYRARVLQFIGVRGLPRVSRKPWLRDILLADRYFARAGAPTPLAPGHTASSPDGTVSVERTAGDGMQVIVRAGEHRWSHALPERAKGSALDLAWGPAGSRTVFLRYPDAPATAYLVLATDMKWRIGASAALAGQSPEAGPRPGP